MGLNVYAFNGCSSNMVIHYPEKAAGYWNEKWQDFATAAWDPSTTAILTTTPKNTNKVVILTESPEDITEKVNLNKILKDQTWILMLTTPNLKTNTLTISPPNSKTNALTISTTDSKTNAVPNTETNAPEKKPPTSRELFRWGLKYLGDTL